MPWIGTVDSGHWTADYRLARLLDYVYTRSGRGRPVVVVGMGLGRDRPGTVGPTVAAEIAKVHPYVFGRPDNPIGRHNLETVFFHITQEFPNSFVLAVDGATGSADEDGHIIAWSPVVEPDEEFIEARHALGMRAGRRPGFPTALDEHEVPRCVTVGTDLAQLPIHVGLVGVVGPMVGSPTAHGRRLAATCDAIIDGILRFFYRTGLLL